MGMESPAGEDEDQSRLKWVRQGSLEVKGSQQIGCGRGRAASFCLLFGPSRKYCYQGLEALR